MIEGIVNVINGFVPFPFAETAWSSAPDGAYGVVSMTGQTAIQADENPVAEKMLQGYVDVFVKANAADPTTAVENGLKAIGVWFRLESIQFEPETGYLHFEWRFTDVLKKASKILFVIRFSDIDGVIGDAQIVERFVLPEIPEVNAFIENGLTFEFDHWTPQVVPAVKNQYYDAVYASNVLIDNGFAIEPEQQQPFSGEQIDDLIAWFENGFPVYAIDNGIKYPATFVGEQEIEYDGRSAQWGQ